MLLWGTAHTWAACRVCCTSVGVSRHACGDALQGKPFVVARVPFSSSIKRLVWAQTVVLHICIPHPSIGNSCAQPAHAFLVRIAACHCWADWHWFQRWCNWWGRLLCLGAWRGQIKLVTGPREGLPSSSCQWFCQLGRYGEQVWHVYLHLWQQRYLWTVEGILDWEQVMAKNRLICDINVIEPTH